jgi:hypothetical protein
MMNHLKKIYRGFIAELRHRASLAFLVPVHRIPLSGQPPATPASQYSTAPCIDSNNPIQARLLASAEAFASGMRLGCAVRHMCDLDT